MTSTGTSMMKKVGKVGSAVSALARSGVHAASHAAAGVAGQPHPSSSSSGPSSSSSPPSTQNAGIQHGQVLNCYKSAHDYVTKIIQTVQGRKALLVDQETQSIVSLVYSQSDMIAKEVFLVESINVIADSMQSEYAEEELLRKQLKKNSRLIKRGVSINEQNMSHLKGVVFIQPSTSSLEKLGVLLKSIRYREYYIFFSNIIPDGFLDSLAELDVSNKIQQVHEYYLDYFVVTPSLWHMNASNARGVKLLQQPNSTFSSAGEYTYSRDLSGILSILLSLKKRPDIRFCSGSESCKRLAFDLINIMKIESELFTFQSTAAESTLLLLLDRKEDVVTPLLTQWTYQAMVHELLKIELNRVLLPNPAKAAAASSSSSSSSSSAPPPPKASSAKTKAEKDIDVQHDVILSPEDDAFFRSTMFLNFGELGIRVKKLVADFQAVTKTQMKMETMADMHKFVDNYPQFTKQSLQVSKHVSVMGEINNIVNERKLLAVSAIEQDLVSCPNGQSEHQDIYEKLHKLLQDEREVRFIEKLKCVILYALRYEHTTNNLPSLRGLLRAHARVSGYDESIVEVIDKVLAASGSHNRTWPLFAQDSDSITLKNVVRSIQSGVKGIDNIYMQHKSSLHEILTTLFAGELKTQLFPFAEPVATGTKTTYRRVIVYMVGGTTYEEYASVEQMMAHPRYKGNFTVLLGGSTIHNSESFLNEIVDLNEYKLHDEKEAEKHQRRVPAFAEVRLDIDDQPRSSSSSSATRPTQQPQRAPSTSSSSSSSQVQRTPQRPGATGPPRSSQPQQRPPPRSNPSLGLGD